MALPNTAQQPSSTAKLRAPISRARTHVGRRKTNQDRFVHDDALGLYLVADGVARSSNGGHAATIVAESVHEAIRRGPQDASRPGVLSLIRATLRAHLELCREAKSDPDLHLMSTTLVALYIDETDRAALVHLGDSRAYRLRAGQLERLTRDHTLTAEAVAEGWFENESECHPSLHNLLTRSMSPETLPQIETTWVDVEPGDLFLLCSDGLTTPVDDESIRCDLLAGGTLGERATTLVDDALDLGGTDNITLVLVQIPGIR